jgi:hypothetical protein
VEEGVRGRVIFLIIKHTPHPEINSGQALYPLPQGERILYLRSLKDVSKFLFYSLTKYS